MTTRTSFSSNFRAEMLRDADTGEAIKCQWCKRRNAYHIHHDKPVCEGGTDEPNNLICLCPKCHTDYHSKQGDFARWGSKGGQVTAERKHYLNNLKQYKNKAVQ